MNARIEARDIGFHYGGNEAIFDGWSMNFSAGEVVAITGPSGRGKSTLLYMIGLMLKPSAGSLVIDGSSMTSLSDSERARMRAHHFGFVFQDAALDPTRSVLDNITETALYRGVSLSGARSTALSLMEQFGVLVAPSRKPGQVSGGQAQRIALCRALLGAPSILIADEPTGNLDTGSAELVMEAFTAHAAAGGLVIVATHDQTLAVRCTRRVEL